MDNKVYDSGSSGSMAVIPVSKPGNKQSFITNATNDRKKTSSLTKDISGDEIREAANLILAKVLSKK